MGSTTATSNERDLVEAAAAGDTTAFHQLYDANVGSVYRYAVARVGRVDADDVTAETFAKAWRALPSFQWTGAPFVTWLYRIASNQIISQRRRESISRRLGHRASQPDVQESFEDGLIDSLDAREIVAVVKALPERQQLVLELRIVRQLSVSEVARLLEITEEATRALTHRALRTLRRTISPAVAGGTRS